MKKKCFLILFSTLLLIFLSTQILALPKLLTVTSGTGTQYTILTDIDSSTHKKSDLFELEVTLTADAFGTNTVNIVAFFDIHIDVSITGDTYLQFQNSTLPDIETEGGSESASFAFNLSDIEDEYFRVYVTYAFFSNNTLGDDNVEGGTWNAREVRVKEASLGIVIPVLAVLSLAYIVHKKQKR